jgi:alpha-ketoglutarate-dependent taurine dioxygenase
MNYHIDNNGWTIILDNFDFSTATQQNINQIAKLLSTNLVVVARTQNLTVEDELRIFSMFDSPYTFNPETEADSYVDGCVLPGSNGYILRVTAKLDADGKPGFAANDGDAIWHCDNPLRPVRKSLTWLYSVAGSVGSKTSWINNALSYNDLDQATKDTIEDLKCQMCHYTDKEPSSYAHTPTLVYTNNAGIRGLFFPFESILRFTDTSETDSKLLIEKLIAHVTQEKYMYHHNWQDGDVILTEQWLSIHNRWPFKDLANRLLHRAIFDFPKQEYK